MVVPRLVGGDCPPVDHVEEHARFKHMLFTPVHCPGSTDCTYPLNFAGTLSRSNRKARFAPNWRVQCAHIRVELARATAKLPALCKIPVLKDTSLCRSWWPAETCNELPELPNSKTRCVSCCGPLQISFLSRSMEESQAIFSLACASTLECRVVLILHSCTLKSLLL